MKSLWDRWRPASVVLVTLALAGCSSGPAPTAEMRAAGDAIARAQYDGARQLAPQPLQMAEGKLANAHDTANRGHMDNAKWLAEESEADADYAGATANQQRIANTAGELTEAQRRRQQPIQSK